MILYLLVKLGCFRRVTVLLQLRVLHTLDAHSTNGALFLSLSLFTEVLSGAMSGRSTVLGIGGIVGIELDRFCNVSNALLSVMVGLRKLFFASLSVVPSLGTGIFSISRTAEEDSFSKFFFSSLTVVPIFGTGILSILRSSVGESFLDSNNMGGEFGFAFFAGGVLFLTLEGIGSKDVDGDLVVAIAGELL